MTHWLLELTALFYFAVAMAYPCCCANCMCCVDASTPTRAKIWYTVVFSGVGNGTCTDCDDWNDTAFVLQRDAPGDCLWHLEDDLPCGFSSMETEIVCSAPGTGAELYDWLVRTIDGGGNDGVFEYYSPGEGSPGDLGFDPIDCGNPGVLDYKASISNNTTCDWSGATATVS